LNRLLKVLSNRDRPFFNRSQSGVKHRMMARLLKLAHKFASLDLGDSNPIKPA
jgi:hypothetical protein